MLRRKVMKGVYIMENLACNLDRVFAVIDKYDRVIDILEDFGDALEIAQDYDALCIETLTDFDGYEGTVADTFWINDTEKQNMVKQKIYALLVIALSLVTVPLLDGDITFAVFMIPCMIYMFFSKQDWIG